MKESKYLLPVILLTLFLSFPASAKEVLTSSLNDQEAVEVTVYNSNIGLVKDLRHVTLRKGLQEVRFMDVAAQIIPTTVNIKPLPEPDAFTVLEQNYEYDLITPRKLIDKYVGRKVKLVTKNPYLDKEEVVEATVLSNNEGVPVFKIGSEITFNHPGRIIFPDIPEDLISKPTLVWLLESKASNPGKIEAIYLTNGINWQAAYVLVLNKKDSAADLSGWVTINNNSGARYNNARLKLVAGDVHRIADNMVRQRAFLTAEKAPAAPQFREDTLFEYHMYSLGRKTTLKENQTKQISLIDASQIPVKKEFIYRGQPDFYRNRYPESLKKEKVTVYVEMMNRKDAGLGVPLPKGSVRVYKEDLEGSLQFVGEDSIDHTPKDEKIRVQMGNAFDIAASRKQTAWEKIDRNTYEMAFEIQLRNHKKEDVTVKVIEPVSGDWKILESSLPYSKIDAFTASFDVPVKKDGGATLTYKVRVRY